MGQTAARPEPDVEKRRTVRHELDARVEIPQARGRAVAIHAGGG